MFSQNFEFDLMTHYGVKVEQMNNDNLIYSNSKNPTYFLMVRGYKDFKEAKLLDIKNSVTHQFAVEQTSDKGQVFFSFKYLDSTPFQPQGSFLAHDFTIDEIEQDSLTKTFKVTFYKNAKRKKQVMSQTIVAKKHHSNLFPLYRVACLHPFEIFSKLNMPENYIVLGGNGTTFQGGQVQTKLLSSHDIQLNLTVPD